MAESEKIKRKNIKFLFTGIFFFALSGALFSFFLPFFLKEQGLTILEIGALFTIGLAFGTFLFSLFYSEYVRKVRLKTGLNISVVTGFLQSFIIFLIPTSIGAFISKFVNVVRIQSHQVSRDVTFQHNIPKGKHRQVSSYNLILDCLGILIGIILAYIIVSWVGFRTSFLIFSFLALPAFYFYSKIEDETRFRSKKKIISRKLPSKLRLIITVEVLYWLALAASFSLVITFLVTDLFNQTMFWIGFLFVGLYTSIILTTLFTKNHFDKFNLLKTSTFGMLTLFFSAVLIIISKNIYFVLVAMILEGIGAAIWYPSKEAVYWKLIGKESRERVAGYLYGWRGLVGVIGPLVGGLLVTYFGILSPFYFKALVSLGIVFVYYNISKKN